MKRKSQMSVQVNAHSHTVSLLFIIVVSMQNYSQFFLKKMIINIGDETSLLNSVLMMLNDFVYN